MKIIYRTSDKLIAGCVHVKGSLEEEALRNICDSELGGSPEDYTVVNIVDSIVDVGYRYKINEDGSVGQELRPKAARKIRLAELKEKGKVSWSEEDRDEILDLLLGSN